MNSDFLQICIIMLLFQHPLDPLTTMLLPYLSLDDVMLSDD